MPMPLRESDQFARQRRAYFDEVGSKGGAGWRDPLAWNAMINDGQAAHEESRGWRGHRENPVRRVDPPGSYR